MLIKYSMSAMSCEDMDPSDTSRGILGLPSVSEGVSCYSTRREFLPLLVDSIRRSIFGSKASEHGFDSRRGPQL